MDLTIYDIILVNSSSGKDSQAMLDVVATMARHQGVLHRVVCVHADLGRVEWPGSKELAKEQAKFYGIHFEVVRRTQGDLLQQIKERGMWPSSAVRYCTSDQKRDQIAPLITRLVRQLNLSRQAQVLNCM